MNRSKNALSAAILALTTSSILLAGCAREVSHTETRSVSSDGTVKSKEKTVTQSSDGTITKKEETKKTTSP